MFSAKYRFMYAVLLILSVFSLPMQSYAQTVPLSGHTITWKVDLTYDTNSMFWYSSTKPGGQTGFLEEDDVDGKTRTSSFPMTTVEKNDVFQKEVKDLYFTPQGEEYIVFNSVYPAGVNGDKCEKRPLMSVSTFIYGENITSTVTITNTTSEAFHLQSSQPEHDGELKAGEVVHLTTSRAKGNYNVQVEKNKTIFSCAGISILYPPNPKKQYLPVIKWFS